MQNLSNTNFYKVYTVYPPYEEQCAIVAEVQKIENEMQAIISTISKEIGILHEFKTRLISDVVTGKIDIRDYSNYRLLFPMRLFLCRCYPILFHIDECYAHASM